MNTTPCVQERLLDFIKVNLLWVVIFPIQIGCSFLISYFPLFLYPSEKFLIPANLSNQSLSLLIDVFIALFGFVGLILVFILGNLLATKRELEKEKFETHIKLAELEMQALGRGGLQLERSRGLLEEASKTIKTRLNQIDNNLDHNGDQINKASSYGTMAIGSSVVCIFIDIWAFGAITEGGLHFLNITLLLSFFFLCLDFTFQGIRTVIR